MNCYKNKRQFPKTRESNLVALILTFPGRGQNLLVPRPVVYRSTGVFGRVAGRPVGPLGDYAIIFARDRAALPLTGLGLERAVFVGNAFLRRTFESTNE